MFNTNPSREATADRSDPGTPAPTATDSDAGLALAHADRVASTDKQSRLERAGAAGQPRIRSERRGSDHVIALCGELDLANAQAVEDDLKAVEATDAREITIDLGGLDFIDSAGLKLVLAADGRSRANGSRLRLLRGPRQVQQIFEITAMTDRLPFAD